jgi:nickel/cobalt exporter
MSGRVIWRALWPALLLALLAALALWAFGGLAPLRAALLAAQEAAQNRLGALLTALRQGAPGALSALCGGAFLYGVLHAAGPGHGKVLLAGYGLLRPRALPRLAALALVASLAQATTALLLVYGLGLAFGWAGRQVQLFAETTLADFGLWALAGLGAYVLARALWALGRREKAHGHIHDHHGHTHGPTCDHAHGPNLAELQKAQGLTEALGLIAAVALRPCAGALFLLYITYALGLWGAGALAVYAMGLGTGAVTVTLAVAAGAARRFLSATEAPQAHRFWQMTEAAFGALLLGAGLLLLTA